MGRYITTKADFTLRRKHKKGSGSTIYENDYTTINPMPNALKGEYVIGDSNFVFTSRLGINSQKKHVRGKFVPNPIGEASAWTMETMVDSGITEETKIRLKPNYNSIKDFACYGSAVKLVQGTLNGVITDFPAEMYLSSEELTLYQPEQGHAGYSFDDEKSVALSGYILYNEYAIDITTKNIQPESVYNPLRYFALCGTSYTYIDNSGNSHDFSGFTVTSKAVGSCYQGKDVDVDHLAVVDMLFADGITIKIDIYKDYTDETVYYLYSGVETGGHIRPKKEIVENYFRDCDDFTAVLLDRVSKPIYTATLETPKETDTQYIYDLVPYTWPSMLGGFNPDLSGPYYSYVDGLMHLAEFYDEFFSDNMWRSLTHEAIKTLDWTYVSNTDGDTQDMSEIDTSRIEPITKIYGRQFDDLKRYADAIKSINTITYNQKSNTPDYTLTDVLENSGWETKTLKITSDKSIFTDSLYSGLSSGYSSSDADNEFLRRLKLNSNYLLSVKGTRKGLDAMLGLFGFTPEEYEIHEYVYTFSGGTYPHFCNYTEGLEESDLPGYPLAKDISTINKYKTNFNTFDPYGDYCGIPVAEIGYWDGDKNLSYIVPWFSYGKNYDDGLYFQKYGGWGKKDKIDINLEIASSVTSITSVECALPFYTETQARLKFAKDFDELLQEAFSESNLYDVFYVTDVSKIVDDYTSASTEDLSDSGISHYFILENVELNQFLGYSEDLASFGWRSISMDEIYQPNTAGTLVLYLESIKDDTTGNNPHVGNGMYDDGMTYISGMSEIFGYSLINRNFIGIDSATCEDIKRLKFIPEKQEDNRKCWFFSDNHYSGYGKDIKCVTQPGDDDCCKPGEGAEEICLLEAEITGMFCGDSVENGDGECGIDIACFLSGNGVPNQAVKIGKGANSSGYFVSNDMNTVSAYTRGSSVSAFDPETKESGTNGEAAANSIINVKNLDIVFNLPECSGDTCTGEESRRFKEYIETSVMPYLSQMIPSTAILSCKFSDEVLPEITYDLTVEPTSATIASGDTAQFNATYIKKSNGRVIGTTTVTNSCDWRNGDWIEPVAGQKGKFKNANTTEDDKETWVAAMYESLSASASCTVSGVEPTPPTPPTPSGVTAYTEIFFAIVSSANPISNIQMESADTKNLIRVYEKYTIDGESDPSYVVDSISSATFTLYSGETELASFICDSTGLKYGGNTFNIQYNGSFLFGSHIEENEPAEQYTLTCTGHSGNTSVLDIVIASGDTPEPPQPTYELRATISRFTIPDTGGNITLRISGAPSTNYTATAGPAWYSFNGDDTVTGMTDSNGYASEQINVQENTDFRNDRSGSITVQNEDSAVTTSAFTQQAATAILEASVSPISVAAYGGSVTLSVTTNNNAKWTATTDATQWTQGLNNMTGNGTTEKTFTVLENDGAERIATITITCENGLSKQITVKQVTGYFLDVQLSDTEIPYQSKAGIVLTIRSLQDTSWTATTSDNWLTLDSYTGTIPHGQNTSTVQCSATKNTSSSYREVTITVQADNGLTETVTLKQNTWKFKAYIIGNDGQMPSTGGQKTLRIEASQGDYWTITEVGQTTGWLSYSNTAGTIDNSGYSDVTITAGANNTGVRRDVTTMVNLSVTDPPQQTGIPLYQNPVS